MRNYAPKYFLINGKAYPDTDPDPQLRPATRCCCATSTPASSTTRWRVLGCARRSSPTTAAAADIRPQRRRRDARARARPATPSPRFRLGDDAATKFALYDGSLMLHNSNTAGFGGMLTFLTAGARVPGPTPRS